VRVDPEHTTDSVCRRHPPERAESDRVVSSEHERSLPGGHGLSHRAGDTRADLADLGQEACALVVDRRRLGLGAIDVPVVAHLVPERADPLLEPSGPHRRGSHVDAASPLAEVERRSDDRDLPRARHGCERYAIEGLD
jgi:hypothetical protein